MVPPQAYGPGQGTTEWKAGDVILGTYEVRRVVATGGMGKVYKVHHRGWGIDLAVKSPRPDILSRAQGAEFFERECELWVNLGLHPNIASCYYVRRLDGLPRVFAEYVSGGTLWSWVQSRHLYRGGAEKALSRILDVASQFAWGLRYAHSQGLVHQDVKTANVLMTSGGVAKVTDFGLSKAVVMATKGDESATQTNTRGTVVYCSPEQARRENLTAATDIWSWAVSILEMFVGDVTWMAGQAADRSLETYLELGPEHESIPEMPEGMVDLLRRCLQAEPDARPADMETIVEALGEIYRATAGEDYPRAAPQAQAMSANHLSNRAVSVLDLGNTKEAEQLWEKALSDQPNHPEATYNRTLLWWRRGKLTDGAAVRMLRELSEGDPSARLPRYLLAQMQLERGDCATAVDLLNELGDEPLHGHNVKHDRASATKRLAMTRKVIGTVDAHGGPAVTVNLSWDGCLILSGGGAPGKPGELKLWDVKSGECLQTFVGHAATVTRACFSADGLNVLSGAADGTLILWQRMTGEPTRVTEAHGGAVLAVCMTGDGNATVSAGADGAIRVWDKQSGDCTDSFDAQSGAVTAVTLCGYGMHLLAAYADGAMRLWEIKSGKCVETFEGDGVPLTALCLSSNQRYALTGDRDGFFALWDLRKGRRARYIKAHSAAITSVCLSKDVHYAVTASPNGKIRIWEPRSSRCLFTFNGEAPVSLSDDGKLAVSGSADGKLHLLYAGCDVRPIPSPMMLCDASS
ncbi:MAG: protein kinase [bacterium]|nr:protein kinase [bacterium]